MALISSIVWDAGLSTIATSCVNARVVDALDAILADITINGSNFAAIADSTGRKLKCLKGSTAVPLTNVDVTLAGTAVGVQLTRGGTVFVQADLTGSTVALTTSDKINLSTFAVRFRALTS